jgi:hypothetical protein
MRCRRHIGLTRRGKFTRRSTRSKLRVNYSISPFLNIATSNTLSTATRGRRIRSREGGRWRGSLSRIFACHEEMVEIHFLFVPVVDLLDQEGHVDFVDSGVEVCD